LQRNPNNLERIADDDFGGCQPKPGVGRELPPHGGYGREDGKAECELKTFALS
jgi:hypothetical protein